jgi:hypothetical protein
LKGPVARPTGLLDHVRRCNNWVPSRFRPFEVAGQPVGRVRDDLIGRLEQFDGVFEFIDAGVRLAARHATEAERTQVMRGVVARLIEDGAIAKLRREDYPIVTRWGEEPLFLLDRGAVAPFGVRAFGLHVNGYVRRGGKMLLWIGRRALDKAVEPGKLDNLVAGGQPAGLTLTENLIKESHEEAGLSRELALSARPAGAITYCMEGERGLKPDTMFVYDLELPNDFEPRNVDGEIVEYTLMELDEVLERVRTSYDFKFNVSLVLIDFLIRIGHITPANEPDYLELVAGLHTPLP